VRLIFPQATLRALQIDVEEENDLDRDALPYTEPHESGRRRRRLPWSSRRTRNRASNVKQERRSQYAKQEEGARGGVKREHGDEEGVWTKSDDLAFIETRGCKRPCADSNVTVLD